MNSFRVILAVLLPALFIILANQPARAGSATWNLNSATGDWNTAGNWTPNTVPNGRLDRAAFGVSNLTDVGLSAAVEVDSIVFISGASTYNITPATASGSTSDPSLTIVGAGIVNYSGLTQTFLIPRVAIGAPLGNILFRGEAKAGVMIVFSNGDGRNEYLASEEFRDDSSADQATFINDGPPDSEIPYTAGMVIFNGRSTAGSATIINNGGSHLGGETFFEANSTAGNATLICNGGMAPQTKGGLISLIGNATCGNGTIAINGSDAAQQGGGVLDLILNSSLGDATVIANGGQMDPGHISLNFPASGGNARVELFGNGELDLVSYQGHVVTIGSLEGTGLVLNTEAILTIGGNSLSTAFSGTIQDNGAAGALTKVGSGTLTLGGASTYTGGTTVSGGVLVAANPAGSATGTGTVSVSAGTFGGNGIVAGTVTIGTGAFLAPAHGTNAQAILTIQSSLTFDTGSTYGYTFKAKRSKAKTDKVIANGVTIKDGATFNLSGTTQGVLTQGMVLTAISNTAATPISGTFSNLADGAIVSVNGNNLQASYEGGDGNDLTLTVIP